MLVATRMQDGQGRRAIASVLALALIIGGLLGLRHEAEVAHVRDAGGAHHHTHELAEHHEDSATPHLHGRDVDGQHGGNACDLLAALEHFAARTTTSLATTAPPVVDATTAPVLHAVHDGSIRYRLAPKTSPPGRG